MGRAFDRLIVGLILLSLVTFSLETLPRLSDSTRCLLHYGDVYPVTVGGKIFTCFVLALGLGVVAVPAGLLASALSRARDLEDSGASADETRAP